jgi:hypothetical protein
VAFMNEAAKSDWSGVRGFSMNSPGRKIWGILTTDEDGSIGSLRRLLLCGRVCI